MWHNQELPDKQHRGKPAMEIGGQASHANHEVMPLAEGGG